MTISFNPNNPQTTKDMIISILSENFPLSIMKIKNQINKQYKKSLTYQAIYKEIENLQNLNIIEKKDKEFQLNKEWIEISQIFFKNLKEKYSNQINPFEIFDKLKEDGDSITLEFESFYEIHKFIFQIIKNFNKYFNDDKIIILHRYITVWYLFHLKNLFESFNSIKSNFFYLYVLESQTRGKSNNFIEALGCKVKKFNNKTAYWNIELFGDFTIQCISDEHILPKFRKYLEETKTLSQVDIKELEEIINEKGKFNLIISKNELIKKHLLKEIEDFF